MNDLEVYRKFLEICKKDHFDTFGRPWTVRPNYEETCFEYWLNMPESEKSQIRQLVKKEQDHIFVDLVSCSEDEENSDIDLFEVEEEELPNAVNVKVEDHSECQSSKVFDFSPDIVALTLPKKSNGSKAEAGTERNAPREINDAAQDEGTDKVVDAKPSKTEDLEETMKVEDEKEEDVEESEVSEKVVTPPPTKKSKGSNAEAGVKAPRKTKVKTIKMKKQKDPLKPKGPVCSFFWFQKEIRPSVAEANPELKADEVSKILGLLWNDLDTEEKAKYQLLAKQDQDRYAKDIAAYKSKKAIEIGGDKEEEPKGELEMTLA